MFNEGKIFGTAPSESGKDSQQKNRLAKASVLALGMMGADSAKGLDEEFLEQGEPVRTENVQRETQVLRKDTSEIIAESLLELEKFVELAKREPHYQDKYEAQIAALKKVLHDENFLSEMEWLRDQGVDISSVLGDISPDILRNRDFIRERISSMPEMIRGKFVLSSPELLPDQEYDATLYEDVRFQDLVVRLSAQNIFFSSEKCKEMIEIGMTEPKHLDALGQLAKGGVGIDGFSFLSDLSELAVLPDPELISAMISLEQSGVSVGGLLGDLSKNYGVTSEQIKDPAFREVLVLAGEYDFLPNIYSIQVIKNLSEKMHDSVYLGNAELLVENEIFSRSRVLEYADYEVFSNVHVGLFWGELEKFDYSSPASLIGKMTPEQLNSDIFRSALLRIAEGGKILDAYDLGELWDARYESDKYIDLFIAAEDSTVPVGVADEMYLTQQGIDRFAITESLGDLLAVTKDYEDDPVTVAILNGDSYLNLAYYRTISGMNYEHNLSDDRERMRALEHLDARAIFSLIVGKGADAYDSTFKLMLDGKGGRSTATEFSLFGKIRTEHNSDVLAFLSEGSFEDRDVSTFLELLSHHDKIHDFFSFVGTQERQQELIDRLYLGLDEADDQLGKAAAIRDTLDALEVGSMRSLVESGIRRTISELEKRGEGSDLSEMESDALTLYKLISTGFYLQEEGEVPKWAESYIAEYEEYLPSLEVVSYEDIVTEIEGVPTNIQRHFYFDDREGHTPSQWDGHNTLKHYLGTKKISVAWDDDGVITSIEPKSSSDWSVERWDRDSGLVVLESQGDVSRIRVVLNTPDKSESGIEAGTEYLEEIGGSDPAPVHNAVMRGHSYHIEKMLEHVDQQTPIIDLGSCGGFRNIETVLKNHERSPYVISTKGTGMMSINDLVKRYVDRAVLSVGPGESINWSDIRDTVDRTVHKLKAKYPDDRYTQGMARGWENYIFPHENGSVQMLSAFHKIKEAQNEE